jgi:Na+/H+-translocating membrane pyrophosphatase
MRTFIQEFLFELSQFDAYTVWVSFFFVTVACMLIRAIVESSILALFAAPLMMIGALLSNYLFAVNFVIASDDKDVHVVVTSAIGVVVALTLVLSALWVSSILSERRTANKTLKTLTGVQRSRS